MQLEKGGDLLLEEVPLEGAEELFGLGQTQPEMLDALVVLVEGDDIGDGFFLTVIVTDDELQFDAHSRASPGGHWFSFMGMFLPFEIITYAIWRWKTSRTDSRLSSTPKATAGTSWVVKWARRKLCTTQ